MPNLAVHTEVAKTAVTGGISSYFAGFLMDYLGVTPPIFVAACLGAIVAVAMLKDIQSLKLFDFEIPARLSALLIALAGSISACHIYQLIDPIVSALTPLDKFLLPQTPATAVLAFILVYFCPLILDVISSRIGSLK